MKKLFFYVPKDQFEHGIPEKREDLFPHYLNGIHAWVTQTYLALKAVGSQCQLVHDIPDEGIIVFHSSTMEKARQPNAGQLFVCIQADYSRHPYSQIHIVQNKNALKYDIIHPIERMLYPGMDYYMRHWPQPGLIPRQSRRGKKFQNVGYFGLSESLEPEMQGKEWSRELSKLGLRWVLKDSYDSWNDYSDIDVVVAIRNFAHHEASWKPATKLYNAWHAGVPCIVDSNSAYQSEHRKSLDFLKAKSAQDVLDHLMRLKQEPGLREKMIENGLERAEDTTEESLTRQWRELFERTIYEHYSEWLNRPEMRLRYDVMWKSREPVKKVKSIIKGFLAEK